LVHKIINFFPSILVEENKGLFTRYQYYPLYQYEFILVSSCVSVFCNMIPAQNLIPVRVISDCQFIPIAVPGRDFRYGTKELVPVSCNAIRPLVLKSVFRKTGTGGACIQDGTELLDVGSRTTDPRTGISRGS